MTTLQRATLSARRSIIALSLVAMVVVGAHLALMYAVLGELDPLLVAADAGIAVVLLGAAAGYLRSLQRERQRQVVEGLMLNLLSTPRNIRNTATEALRVLAEHQIGNAAVIAILDEADEALHPLSATGFPRGWVDEAPAAGTDEMDAPPALSRPQTPHPWVEALGGRLGQRPWVASVPLVSGRDRLGLLLIVSRRPGVLRDRAIPAVLSVRLGAAIDHAALYEAAYARERDLEDLESRRREFMAAIAHEIRTPLTSIQAFAELLRLGEGAMDETAEQLVASLSHGVTRLGSVVNDLIDLGRSGEATYALVEQNVDVLEVLRDAEATLRPAIMVRSQGLTLSLPETPLVARIDRRVLDQVVLNLISNANRHTPPGGTITICAYEQDGWVQVDVEDTGPGIPPEERERIFEPYYRVSRPDAMPVPGSGLGLAVARRLLDGAGGRIWVEASEAGGARFRVQVRVSGSRQP